MKILDFFYYSLFKKFFLQKNFLLVKTKIKNKFKIAEQYEIKNSRIKIVKNKTIENSVVGTNFQKSICTILKMLLLAVNQV